jgi:hypothetical protein
MPPAQVKAAGVFEFIDEWRARRTPSKAAVRIGRVFFCETNPISLTARRIAII